MSVTPSLLAVEAALRSAASGLGGATVQLYLAGPDGRLARTTSDGPDLALVAELLNGEVAAYDVSSVAEDYRVAVGVGWSAPSRGALLALGTEPPPDARARLADAAAVVQALTAPILETASDATRLLASLATQPGSFDERLESALERLAGLLGMDAAALARTDSGRWTPLAAFDPHAVLPAPGVPMAETPCAVTTLADGPVGVPDGTTDGEGAFGAFLGAPVWSDGRCVGTLCALASAPRAPFTEGERDLVAALARWAGVALAGREAAARLTEREATLATFLDTVPLGLGTLDLDADAPGGLRLVSANVHAARAIGATDLLHADGAPDPRERWAGACRRALASGAAATFSFKTLRDDEPRRYVATIVVLDPAVPRFTFVAEDVTERDAGTQAAADLRRVEATASEARRALLTHVTHELRSPLTAILGYADLLGEHSAPDEVVEAREVIARAGRQILTALDNLGTLALVDAGRVTAAAAPVYAGAVVAEIAEAHRLPAATRRATLAVDVALPAAPVLLDPDLFERLVRTLVGAAVAATTDGRIDGRLSVDGDALVFDLAARPAEPGAGLGPLAADFVRRLVGVMGGTVDAGHDGGGDAWRWTVRLPYRPVPLVDLAPFADGPPASPVPDAAPVGEGVPMAAPVLAG